MDLSKTESMMCATGRATYFRHVKPYSTPIVLLHGGGLDCASLSWRRLFPVLGQTNSVFAPNWPGYGGSDPLGGPYTIADLGRWLLSLMDALEIENAHMVGLSMGGGVALWVAIHHPERAERLVPVGTYGVQGRAPYHLLSYLTAQLPLNTLSYALMRRNRGVLVKALQMIFADPAKLTDDIVDEVAEILQTSAVGRVFSNFQRGEMTLRGLRTVLTPQLKAVHHPALFIHGRSDNLVPLVDVQAAASKMPSARVDVMDAGHWPMRECPLEFNEKVVAFLRI